MSPLDTVLIVLALIALVVGGYGVYRHRYQLAAGGALVAVLCLFLLIILPSRV